MSEYNARFYERLADASSHSAQVITPLILDAVSVTSVLDVGCGIGNWLRAFQDRGVDDAVGLDGDHVARELLKIPTERFRPHDLTKPFALGRRFDLVLSVEVAEHLPQSCAQQFVRCLTEHSDVVLFSAAIPGQGGTGHINEQWQSYWAALFAERGYTAIDYVRPRIWTNNGVASYYRQNIVLYANPTGLARNPALAPTFTPLDVIHPEQYAASRPDLYLSGTLKALPGLLMKAVRDRL